MNLIVDRPALQLLYWLRDGRGRHYYLAEAPALGVVVSRCGRLEELVGLVVDANLGNEIAIEGWSTPGTSGRKQGKATLYRVVEEPADLSLNEVLFRWRQRYQ